MKNKAFFCVAVVAITIISCSTPIRQKDKHSFLHQLADSLLLNRDKNIIIYSINPNDCINCLHVFADINSSLSTTSNSKIYVMLTEREIEKQELIRTSQGISFTDSINKKVIWNRHLYERISAATGNRVLVSLFTVYDYKRDSVLFTQPIKSIPDARALLKYLGK